MPAAGHEFAFAPKCQVQSNCTAAALLTLLILVLASASPPPGLPGTSAVERDAQSAPEFAVPFACDRTFPVSQAHATGSHLMNDTWAWDFRMPSGVPIVAAGDGTVRLARGDSTLGGCDPSFAAAANYVVIAHPSGYETQYLHLESVVVAAGDQVKEGDLLGYSGKTGWACGSHLHFKVARPEGTAWNNPSVPSRLKGYGDPPIESWVAAPRCDPKRLEALVAKRSVDAAKVANKPEQLANAPSASAQARSSVIEPQVGSGFPAEQEGPSPSATGAGNGGRRSTRAALARGIGATE